MTLYEHLKVCKRMWKWIMKIVNWRRCFEFKNYALFIMSHIPFHSCLLIWKDAMQPWMNTIWNMSKNQKKFCTGSLGTGSDTGRTRFLVNVITRNSKFTRRNRFPYRYNPVPGTKTRGVFFEKVWNPVPCMVGTGSWKFVLRNSFWKLFQT